MRRRGRCPPVPHTVPVSMLQVRRNLSPNSRRRFVMRHVSRSALGLALCLSLAPAALAGAHTWDVWEVFSNASGTVQFVELKDPVGTAEDFIGGHQIQGNPSATVYTIQNNLSGGT